MQSIIIEDGKDSYVRQFLETFLIHIGKDDASREKRIEFISCDGWTNLSKIRNILTENQDANKQNLIIFDADFELNDGGFEKRKNQIKESLQRIEINNYKIFLFPNNNDDGDFEILLEKIINTDHKCLLDCFKNYEECLSKFTDDKNMCKYNLPVRKSKMYSYIDAFPKNKEEKERFKSKKDWFFNNKIYWDLDNDYLKPLIFFLKDGI